MRTDLKVNRGTNACVRRVSAHFTRKLGAFIVPSCNLARMLPFKNEVILMSKSWLMLPALALSLLWGAPLRAEPSKPAAPTACPQPVTAVIARTFPKSTITKCKAEHEHGRDQFEVKLTKADGAKAEVDVAADGKILQIEEKVPVDKLPTAVVKAFSAKYPKAKIDAAEKQTPAEGPASYELGFATDSGRKEATFTEDGKFVEEE